MSNNFVAHLLHYGYYGELMWVSAAKIQSFLDEIGTASLAALPIPSIIPEHLSMGNSLLRIELLKQNYRQNPKRPLSFVSSPPGYGFSEKALANANAGAVQNSTKPQKSTIGDPFSSREKVRLRGLPSPHARPLVSIIDLGLLASGADHRPFAKEHAFPMVESSIMLGAKTTPEIAPKGRCHFVFHRLATVFLKMLWTEKVKSLGAEGILPG